jgi:hypothetical protein
LGGKLRKFRLRDVRGQNIDFVFCNAERYTSLAAPLWAADRVLKTPTTTGFMILFLSVRLLIGALGGIGNNQVFAGKPWTPRAKPQGAFGGGRRKLAT